MLRISDTNDHAPSIIYYSIDMHALSVYLYNAFLVLFNPDLAPHASLQYSAGASAGPGDRILIFFLVAVRVYMLSLGSVCSLVFVCTRQFSRESILETPFLVYAMRLV